MGYCLILCHRWGVLGKQPKIKQEFAAYIVLQLKSSTVFREEGPLMDVKPAMPRNLPEDPSKYILFLCSTASLASFKAVVCVYLTSFCLSYIVLTLILVIYFTDTGPCVAVCIYVTEFDPLRLFGVCHYHRFYFY